jgi:hypothetical protein
MAAFAEWSFVIHSQRKTSQPHQRSDVEHSSSYEG